MPFKKGQLVLVRQTGERLLVDEILDNKSHFTYICKGKPYWESELRLPRKKEPSNNPTKRAVREIN